ncbi:MAG: GNAT family N-acetyltransferase [Gemmatimonadaceae bacterium]
MIYEVRAGELLISTDTGRLDLGVIHAFLREAYWSPDVPLDTVRRAIEGSLAFGAYAGARQVGFARVVSDRATFAYLADVFVVEEFRRMGIGTRLIAAVLRHPELQGLRRWVLVTRDAQALYRKHSFVPLANAERWMVRLPDIAREGAPDTTTWTGSPRPQ